MSSREPLDGGVWPWLRSEVNRPGRKLTVVYCEIRCRVRAGPGSDSWNPAGGCRSHLHSRTHIGQCLYRAGSWFTVLLQFWRRHAEHGDKLRDWHDAWCLHIKPFVFTSKVISNRQVFCFPSCQPTYRSRQYFHPFWPSLSSHFLLLQAD